MKPFTPIRSLAASLRALRPGHTLLPLLLLCFLCVPPTQAQPDSRRISFYTPQTSYALSVLDRNNTGYVGLLEALEPLGPVSGRAEGKKYKLTFRDIDGQFEAGKTNAKIHGKNIELPAPFFLENDRGFVPITALKTVLPAFGVNPVDVHDSARRVFVGGISTHVTARKSDNAKIIFTFSSPVNPFIATEPGKLRMTFDREPLQSDTRLLTFDDKAVPSAAFSESNGTAELTVTGTAPLTAAFSDDRTTITVSAVIPAVQQTQPSTTTTAATGQPASSQSSANSSQGATPIARPHTYVIIDAAHGGADRGSTIGRLSEKDITLALAHRVRHELELRGITASLVRDGDTTLTPDQRVSIVNASSAALYLCIHASASGTGIRVFASPIAQQPSASPAALAFVPLQTAQAAVVNQSRGAAAIIAQNLAARELRAASLPAFIVPLSSIAIPAVAIEIAPANGSPDSLGNASYQQSIASSISAAVAAVRGQPAREVTQ